MKHLNIRWRITLWNTAGFSAVLFGFGLLVYSLLRGVHYDQIDRELTSRFQELAEAVRLADAAQSPFQEWVRSHPGVSVVVFDSLGQTVVRSKSLATNGLSPSAARSSNLVVSDSISLPALGHVRRLAGRIAIGEAAYTAMFFKDLNHTDEEMAEVITSLLITAPIALGLAAVVAYLMARKALAPVEQLRQLTDEITADRLHQRLSNSNPSDEIGMLAQTINSMIERLEKSFVEIRRFMADASHELRTPIAVIRSESELGVENSVTLEDVQKRFSSILEECARLSWTTDQLLTLAREDAGIIAPLRERTDLLGLVHDTVETMRPVANEKNQVLVACGTVNLVTLGDASRLRRYWVVSEWQ